MESQKKKIWWMLMSVVAVCGLMFTSCDKDEDEVTMGNWTRMSDFDGMPRSDAFAFAIGKSGYIETGYEVPTV